MKKQAAVLFLFFISMASFAQDDSLDNARPSLKFDINYLSNSVYLGRKDSQTISYITPGILFASPSGFFAGATASFLTDKKRFDLFTIEAGYDWYKNNWDLGISGAKYFFNSGSVNVKSDLTASISATASYTLAFIKPLVSVDVSVGNNKPDYTGSFALEHSFTASDAFTVTPSFMMNASTQNYYDGYYQNRRYGKGRKAKTIVITAQALDASKFKIMDYELMADAEYKVKNFSFYFDPVYAVPVNPNVITTTIKPPVAPATSRTTVEKIENSFYFTVGVSWRLKVGKGL